MKKYLHDPKHPWLVPALIICVAAAVGLADSFFLVLEYMEAIIHPGQLTPCTVNSLVSCTLTVQGPWAHFVPTIPNPMWGMLWYAGFVGYGLTLAAGSQFTRRARAIIGVVLMAGLLFSYRLYFASIFELRGVCPFCLTSTTASTLIALSFIVEDLRHPDALVRGFWKKLVYAFQAVSVIFFVIGLPLFIARGLQWIPNKMAVVTHWSFPLMVGLVLVMAAGHVWAFKRLRQKRQ